MHRSIFFIVGMMFGLSACTTIAPQAPPSTLSWSERQATLSHLQNWHLNGKIAVQTTEDSGSATVDWVQNNNSYTVSLLGPLGANGLKLTGQPGLVTLTMADGKRFTASNPEELLAKQWGFHLPVSYLRYWIRGLPVPGVAASNQFDASHRLMNLTQDGWQVQFLNYTHSHNLDLPSKLFITSSTTKVKILIYSWK